MQKGPKPKTIPWIIEHSTFQGDGCLFWPFITNTDHRPRMRFKGKLITPTRFMCELVNGPPPTEKHHAAHECGNGHIGCIHPKHLKWKTPVENAADKILHGTERSIGSRNPRAKLSEGEVLEIREAHRSGLLSQKELSVEFGVTISVVSKIIRRLAWTHV